MTAETTTLAVRGETAGSNGMKAWSPPVQSQVALMPTQDEFALMMELSSVFVRSGLMPDGIRTPEAAFLVMLKGKELGIPATEAMSKISVIKGKPSCSAELILSLIKTRVGPDAMIVEETDSEHCTVSYARPTWSKRREFSFTVRDAELAGLVAQGGNWTKYRPAMLRARCISACGRMEFPEVIGGLYTYDEMGATVNEDGEILSIPTGLPAPRIAQAVPVSAQPEPVTISQPETPAAPEDERAHLMAKIHAIAADKASLGHPAVKAMALPLINARRPAHMARITSMAEMSIPELRSLANWFDRSEPAELAAKAAEVAAAVSAVELPAADPEMAATKAAMEAQSGPGKLASQQSIARLQSTAIDAGYMPTDLDAYLTDTYGNTIHGITSVQCMEAAAAMFKLAAGAKAKAVPSGLDEDYDPFKASSRNLPGSMAAE